jgi:hypothetical protein
LKERFLDDERKGLGESSSVNEYQKEIDDLKRLVGDQALAVDALKKSTREEAMMVVGILRKEMPVARISRAMDIPRSSIYYRKTERSGNGRSRVSENIETDIIMLSADLTTYGYRRIWSLLRNFGIHANIKTVRKIMSRKNLTKPDNINILWKIDTHYVVTVRDGMVYLMSIKDCFTKKWISYEFSKTCTTKDRIKAVENVYVIRFLDENHHDLILRTNNGPQ